MKGLSDETSCPHSRCKSWEARCTSTLRIIAVILAIILMAGCSDNCWEGEGHDVVSIDDTIDVRQFISWTEEDFAQAFGQPHHCRNWTTNRVCFYHPLGTELHVPPGCTVGFYELKHRVEAQFRNGTLDYVIIRPGNERLEREVLLRYGLPETDPDRVVIHSNQYLGGKIWDDYAGYEYLAVYMSHSGISHESGSIDRIEVNISGEPNWSTAGYMERDCDIIHKLSDYIAGGVCLETVSSPPVPAIPNDEILY